MNQHPPKQALAAMTMNERLFACNLVDAFDGALRNGDRKSFIHILEQVLPSKQDAEAYADTHFENLRRRINA